MTKEVLSVSVIVPMYNASEFVAQALESLIAQSAPNWEAIVIDDGSTDQSLAVARGFAERDSRIRVLNQSHQGVSVARNKGIRQAKFDWLLFMDADDWILPDFLEKMTALVQADPTLDAAYCRYARRYPDGSQTAGRYVAASPNLFAAFTRFCAFAIHTCIVRRSVVDRVGGFDPSLITCQDWDFWQRVARAGSRFDSLNEVLVCYRVRPTSASMNWLQILRDGLRVIQRGHSIDPRVPNSEPALAAGMPIETMAKHQLQFACWCAGLAIGNGQDGQFLLKELTDIRDPGLEPQMIADTLFLSALLPKALNPTNWPTLWPVLQPRIHQFLQALEKQSLTPGLTRRVTVALERMILDQATLSTPITLELTAGTGVEIAHPIQTLSFSEEVERVYCKIEMEGKHLGVIELPVLDGEVSSYVLEDAIAAEYAWTILKRFFHDTIYRELSFEAGPNGLSLRRGKVVLADGLPPDVDKDPSHFHDQIGWLVLLQEVWSRPDWENKNFYEDVHPQKTVRVQNLERDVFFVEITDELPDLKTISATLQVIYGLGGTVIGSINVPVQRNLLPASQLRVAINFAAGFELCRAAVREGLLGKPLSGIESLHSRLAAAKKYRDPLPYSEHTFLATLEVGPISASNGQQLPEHGIDSASERDRLILGRRVPGNVGTSHSRRAVLPLKAASELVTAARFAGETVLNSLETGHLPHQVVYAPELVSQPDQDPTEISTEKAIPRKQALDQGYRRDHFESIFAASADPWDYTSDYERVKYEQTLELLPNKQYNKVLEIGCAEGHFTRILAPRVEDLVAADISVIALRRAAARCLDFENIDYVLLDLTKDTLQGPFDLIVCSEVLYYVGDQKALQAVIQKIASAIRPGGYFLTAHAHLVVDEPKRTGFDWAMPFGAKAISDHAKNNRLLCLKKEVRTPLYRVQLFQRRPRLSIAKVLNRPQITKLKKQPTQLLPEIANHVLWNGADKRPEIQAQPMVTSRLPIFMYHRVAPEGSSVLADYRVSPDAFEDQLRYLRDAGYYSLTLDEWHIAAERKKPLPGKPILLTFDDGYCDFKEYAWPLLKQYGFSATVFLVASQIGKTNRWDAYYGESLPLLDWPDILLLQKEGIEFGSHTATHPHLTGISLSDVVKEACISRKVLQEGLGKPVPAFAYPYGSTDPVVQHLVGACGYIYGLTSVSRLSEFNDPMLALPRVEVSGSDDLGQFIQKLPAW